MEKAGIKTTEFWTATVLPLVVTVLEVFQGSGLNFGPKAGVILGAAYVISRGLVKAFSKK
jgi:hypothetical protein